MYETKCRLLSTYLTLHREASVGIEPEGPCVGPYLASFGFTRARRRVVKRRLAAFRQRLTLAINLRVPWPGFEPGRLAALPPQSGGNGLASSAIMVHRRACRWSNERWPFLAFLMRRNGDRIPGAKRGPNGRRCFGPLWAVFSRHFGTLLRCHFHARRGSSYDSAD